MYGYKTINGFKFYKFRLISISCKRREVYRSKNPSTNSYPYSISLIQGGFFYDRGRMETETEDTATKCLILLL